MGFRFRRRIRIAKGIHLNLSNSGVSASVSPVRGVTLNSRGRVTASVPGTGLSWSEQVGSSSTQRSAASPSASTSSHRPIPAGPPLSETVIGYLLAVVGGAVASPIGIIASPVVLWGLNKLITPTNANPRPNRFMAWAAFGVIGAPICAAIASWPK